MPPSESHRSKWPQR